MKLAAIDIGTNAVRLLLSNVMKVGGQPIFKKESLVRIPLRLGEDVFTRGFISEEKIGRLVESMIGFKHLIRAYPALDYRAVATSAMRESKNGEEVAAQILKGSGIRVEIIDGQREAEFIYANYITTSPKSGSNHLFVDVGGGSTEISILVSGRGVDSSSFKVGTVRILQDQVSENDWKKIKHWIKSSVAGYRPVVAVGSGGNINKIFRLARCSESKPLTFKGFNRIHKYLKSFEPHQLITKLGLRPDRADVIVPACEIYLSVMKWAKAREIYVPQVGLADGLVHMLYDRHRGNGLG